MVFRAGDGGEGGDDILRGRSDIFGILADLSVRHKAPTDLADRDTDLLEHVLFPNEHGKSPAADNHNHGAGNSPAIPTEVCLAAAADVCVRMDLQPVPAAAFCRVLLDDHHRME